MNNITDKNQVKINKIEITSDTISGRGGLVLFLRYLEETSFYSLLSRYLEHIKKSKKGLTLYQFLKQIMAFFIDGTDMTITGFDRKRNDGSYAAVRQKYRSDRII